MKKDNCVKETRYCEEKRLAFYRQIDAWPALAIGVRKRKTMV